MFEQDLYLFIFALESNRSMLIGNTRTLVYKQHFGFVVANCVALEPRVKKFFDHKGSMLPPYMV